MNRILQFLRNLDKRRIIFVLQKVLGAIVPMRPYATCGTGTCPCPCAAAKGQRIVTGIAAARESASVHIGLRPRAGRPSRTA